MILILEGPDGSGKTTLATRLHATTGYPIYHRSKPENDEDKANMMEQLKADFKKYKNVIVDRCWYSEIVYGNVMRDGSVIDYPEMYDLERLALSKGALLIYCTGDPAAMYKRATARGEDYITSFADYMQICRSYDRLMFDMPHLLPVVRYTV